MVLKLFEMENRVELIISIFYNTTQKILLLTAKPLLLNQMYFQIIIFT